MKRGMTILERRKLRAEILEKEMARAYERAQGAGLTLVCRDAMRVTGSDPGMARGLHARCVGESSLTGGGCLCQCHDVITGGVAAGTMSEAPGDA
jgi:hypothetical protein